MTVKRTATHARASLLDRLIDSEPDIQQEARALRALPIEEWRRALFRDLEWLFNTYCSLSEAELANRQRTVIDYGILDFSTFFTQNPSDHRRLAQMFEEALAAYEPRLKGVKVTIETIAQESHHHNKLQLGLDARVDAVILMDNVEEPVSFLIQGNPNEGIKLVNEYT